MCKISRGNHIKLRAMFGAKTRMRFYCAMCEAMLRNNDANAIMNDFNLIKLQYQHETLLKI